MAMSSASAWTVHCVGWKAAAAGQAADGICCSRVRYSGLKCSRVPYLGSRRGGARAIGAQGRTRVTAWFKFGNRGLDSEGAGIYASQGRDEFDRDDVEQYFNYMGMLATEGTYDKMEALLGKGIHPVDILLLLAASEGDRPKIEELLRAGARSDVTDVEGRTAVDRASSEEIREFIIRGSKVVA